MPETLPSDDLQRVYRFVNERIGFAYAPDRMSDLERGFFTACQDLGLIDPASCIQALNDPARASAVEEALIKKLTIGETYFFRDKFLFQQLRDNLLPNLIRTRRVSGKYLRIWSAACSTGEEPYSLAILISYLLPDINDWEVTILASDINPSSLHAAEKGIYSRWSFREESPVPIDRYVLPSIDGRFQVSDQIRRMVRFSRLNLINDRYPSPLTGTMTMDLILCRNVLMYFSSELASGVVDRLNSALIEGGWLVVSPQEISYAQHPHFIQVKRSSVFLFRKGTEDEKKDTPHTILTPPVTGIEIDQDEMPGEGIPDSVRAKSLHKKKSSIQDLGSPLQPLNPVVIRSQKLQTPLASRNPTTEDVNPDLLIQAGRLNEAELLLLDEDSPSPKIITTMGMLAKIYADQGDPDHALGWCDRILSVDPLYAGAYHLRAVIQQDQGDLPAAIQSLRQALYAEPDYIPAHLMLGTALRSQGRQPEARRHFQIALDLLSSMTDDAPVDETDGMPAVRVREMVRTLLAGVTP
ncbi:CheR family methyltransferase [uncultured Methanospirillum sp.]|uniref:CheR family methyltransferase n=1 Tax=uncultured Methanospirillum sp. TaxID=262503 RepID=UPI0029C5FCB1|nr:CheR family methyltransferase [uncultured Methanospirillum sp.]